MRHRYIIAYDIADPKRLNRVFRKMQGFGDPVQYSVFCCDLSRQEKVIMQLALIELINRREDRIILVDVGPIDGRGSDSIESVGRAISLIDHRRPVIV